MTAGTEFADAPGQTANLLPDIPHTIDGRQISEEVQHFRLGVGSAELEQATILDVLPVGASPVSILVADHEVDGEVFVPETQTGSSPPTNRLVSHSELATKVVPVSERKDVRVISGYRSGPDTLEHRMTDDAYRRNLAVYERDQAPHATLAYGRSLGRLFAERMQSLNASGHLPSEGKLRICVLGSGPSIEVKGLLDALQDYPDIYDRTVVVVTDKHEATLNAVESSGYLSDHLDSDEARTHVKFQTMDATSLQFDPGQEPHMLVACNVLGATDARRLVDIGDGKGIRRMLQAANLFGKLPMVKVNTTSGEAITVPVSHVTPREFLDQLGSASDRDELHAQLFGRLAESDEVSGATANANFTAPTTLPLDNENWKMVKGWKPRKLRQLFDRFLHGNLKGITGNITNQNKFKTNEWYNFSEATEDFAATAIQAVDSNIGIVVVSDYGRTDPNIHTAAPFEPAGVNGLKISQHFGDVTHNLVEMWRLQEEAEAAGAHVAAHSSVNAWQSMLIDRSPISSVRSRTLEVWDEVDVNIEARATSEIDTFVGVIQRIAEEYAGRPRQELTKRIEGEFAGSPIPAHAKESSEVLTEIAAVCNQFEIFDTGLKFAQRAIDLAPHMSILGRIRKAEARFALAFEETDEAAFNAGRDETEKILLEARDLFPGSAVIHETLLSFYQATENPAGIVRSSADYLNTARGLSPEEVVRQLEIQCNAQMSIVLDPNQSDTPTRVSVRRRDIDSQGTLLGDTVYAPFTTHVRQSDVTEAVTTVSRANRIKAQTMVSSAMKVIAELRADGPPWLFASTLESLGAYLEELGNVRLSELELIAPIAGSLTLLSVVRSELQTQ